MQLRPNASIITENNEVNTIINTIEVHKKCLYDNFPAMKIKSKLKTNGFLTRIVNCL